MPFCHQCGKEIPSSVTFCPYCGAKNILQQSSQLGSEGVTPNPHVYVTVGLKSPGLATALAGLFGIFGIWGIGHIYDGKVGYGVAYLILGVIVNVLEWLIAVPLFFGGLIASLLPITLPHIIPLAARDMMVIAVGITFFDIVCWVGQTYEAYAHAKQWNKAIQETGKAPW